MKVPSKEELYNWIDSLEKQNQKLLDEKNHKLMEEWKSKSSIAYEVFWKFANSTFPNLVTKVSLDHIDMAGYWFTFELVNDSRRQTYAVRHSDLPKEN